MISTSTYKGQLEPEFNRSEQTESFIRFIHDNQPWAQTKYHITSLGMFWLLDRWKWTTAEFGWGNVPNLSPESNLAAFDAIKSAAAATGLS